MRSIPCPFDSFNYASTTDVVPDGEAAFGSLLNILGGLVLSGPLREALEKREQLMLLTPPDGAIGLNHDFQNLVFQEIIENVIKDYLACNGEYE